MKNDGIIINEATLHLVQAKLGRIPQRERRRSQLRRLAAASVAAALAVGVVWLRPEPTSTTVPAEDWLHKTTTIDLVESLEHASWESSADEVGVLLSDEELHQISRINSPES